MPPKRKVATQPTAIPSTRKAPTRGAGAVAKKLAEPESEPETVETTELEDIDDIEDDEDTAPKRRRETGKKHPPPSSSLVSLLQPTQKPAAARTTTTSKSRGRTGKASKANAKDVESGTEDDLGGTIEKAQGVGGEGIGIPEGTRKEKAQPLPKAKPIRKRLTKKERDALANREIAETQFTPVRIGTEKEVEVVEVEDQEEEEEETSRKGGEDDAVSPQALPKSTSRKREASPARQPSAKRPNPHGKSSVDGAQGNGSLVEALLRKQAEEMTRRFHETDTRLKELTKLKLTDAEAALAKYKEVMEARIATSENINKAMQSDVDALRTLPVENKSLQKELVSKDHELNTLNARLNELEKSLEAAQSEKQALQIKLIAARNTLSHPPGPPGFPAKQPTKSRDQPYLNGQLNYPGGTSSGNTPPWETVAKEDLYGDLTGLTVLGVKVFPDNPGIRVYDCIQTGKNGTLHFHLTTPVQATDEEDEFTFTPLLDHERDRVIISLLPDYLTEEITFSRLNATRFYLKLLGVIMKPDATGVGNRVGEAVVPEVGGEGGPGEGGE